MNIAVGLVIGLITGIGVSTLLATLLALMIGRLEPWISILALLAGAVSAALVAARLRGAMTIDPPRRGGLVVIGLFAAVCIRQSLGLAYEQQGQVMSLVPYNYGDLPLHWTYIRYLANATPFWPANPIFTGQSLHYPLGTDLLTAMLVQAGLSVPAALTALGLLGSALLAAALFAWGRTFAVAGFLFAGGLAGFEILRTGVLRDAQSSVVWKSLYLALWLPQRGFLFALPAGLILLWHFREELVRGRRGLPPWLAGLLWGVMPLFHAHTFLFVSVLVAVWAVTGRRLRAALPPLLIALGPATFLLWQVTEGFRMASIVWWKPGWVIGPENPWLFLAVNFGFALPLALAAAALAVRDRSREGMMLAFPGLLGFALLFFVMFAPWDWDNTKLMLWCYVLLLAPLRDLVRRMPRLAQVAALVLLFGSGAVSIAAACLGREKTAIANAGEVAGVCEGLRGLAAADRVATAQTFNHPVALCGHALVAGYAGHLWSHGIDAREVEENLKALMQGAPDWRERARRLEARYIFWGDREAAAYPGSTQPWAIAAPVAHGPWGGLYSAAAGEHQGERAQDE